MILFFIAGILLFFFVYYYLKTTGKNLKDLFNEFFLEDDKAEIALSRIDLLELKIKELEKEFEKLKKGEKKLIGSQSNDFLYYLEDQVINEKRRKIRPKKRKNQEEIIAEV